MGVVWARRHRLLLGAVLQHPGANGANAVVAARSVDGGMTWDHIQRIPGGFFDTNDQSTDKNATTADPVKAGFAYTVWDTLILPTDNPDDNPHAQAYTGP